MNHFDEMTVLLFLEGQLDAGHAQDVRTHAASCVECRKLLHALEGEGVWLRESLTAEDESIPARLVAAPERGSAPWGWLTAFGLGVGGAYTVWSGVIVPWQAQAAEAGFTQGNLLTMLFFSGSLWKGWDAMRSGMEFVAMATLALILIWLLRRQFRRATAFSVVMAAALFAFALPPSAAAAETEHGDPNYTLAAGQEIKTDLIVAADRIVIDGTVDGDLITWSRSVTVNGEVKGDVISWGQSVNVNGTVGGNVRTFCQMLTVAGSVQRNVMAWSGDVNLDQKSKVGGTVTLGAGDGDLNGTIGGDVLAFMGSLGIDGRIGGNVRVRSGHLAIGSAADITGSTKYLGNHRETVASGAKLGSPVQYTLYKHGPDRASPRYYWHQILLWGASFVFGLAILLLAPGFFYDVTNACKKVAPTSGLGALFFLATPVAAILLCITIVGIPVAIATVFVYVVAIYAAQVFVGTWIGEKILGAAVGIGPTLGRLALGLAIIRAVRVIPYAGALFGSIVVIWGLGALLLTVYKYMRPQYAPAAA